MDALQLAKLLNIATPSQQAEIDAKIEECYDKLTHFYPNLIRHTITVMFDLRGTTAGQAIGTNKIRLNIDLLNSDSYEEMLNVTLPHEVAHCIQQQLWPTSKSHGREWKHLMYLLGLPANVTHNMKTKKVRVHKRPHRYECSPGCSANPHYLTELMHTRIQSNWQGRVYQCTRCGRRLR